MRFSLLLDLTHLLFNSLESLIYLFNELYLCPINLYLFILCYGDESLGSEQCNHTLYSLVQGDKLKVYVYSANDG